MSSSVNATTGSASDKTYFEQQRDVLLREIGVVSSLCFGGLAILMRKEHGAGPSEFEQTKSRARGCYIC